MEEVLIRFAEERDIPSMMALSGEAFDEGPFPYSYFVYREILYSETSVVAECNGALAGFAAFVIPLHSTGEAWGYSLAVDRRLQGKGVAKALMQRLREIAVEKSVKSILVMTDTNDRVYKLYLRLGFKIVETKKDVVWSATDKYLLQFDIQ